MKQLKEWLNKNERTASWLSRRCEVSPAAVKYWFDGTTTPSFRHRVKIFEITGIKL